MTLCRVRVVALTLLTSGLLSACGEEAPPPRPECLKTDLGAQPTGRVAAGTTHYLPTLDPACGAHQWALAASPAGNTNTVVAVPDDHARFTPIAPDRKSVV